jgi:hypothetical protein
MYLHGWMNYLDFNVSPMIDYTEKLEQKVNKNNFKKGFIDFK